MLNKQLDLDKAGVAGKAVLAGSSCVKTKVSKKETQVPAGKGGAEREEQRKKSPKEGKGKSDGAEHQEKRPKARRGKRKRR